MKKLLILSLFITFTLSAVSAQEIPVVAPADSVKIPADTLKIPADTVKISDTLKDLLKSKDLKELYKVQYYFCIDKELLAAV